MKTSNHWLYQVNIKDYCHQVITLRRTALPYIGGNQNVNQIGCMRFLYADRRQAREHESPHLFDLNNLKFGHLVWLQS